MCGGLESRFPEKLISFRTAKSMEKFLCVCYVKLYKVWKVSNVSHGGQRKWYTVKVCCGCGINPDTWEEAAQDRFMWCGLINSGTSAYKDCRCQEAMQQHQLCKSRASEISPCDQPPHVPACTVHCNRPFTAWVGLASSLCTHSAPRQCCWQNHLNWSHGRLGWWRSNTVIIMKGSEVLAFVRFEKWVERLQGQFQHFICIQWYHGFCHPWQLHDEFCHPWWWHDGFCYPCG